jgi:hypothetical protein
VHDRNDMSECCLAVNPVTSKQASCVTILVLQYTEQKMLGANVLVAFETGGDSCLCHHVLFTWCKHRR